MTELRIYDDRSDAPQPVGPVALDVPDDATDDQVIEAIREGWADRSRTFVIGRQDGAINPGWKLLYPAEQDETLRRIDAMRERGEGAA